MLIDSVIFALNYKKKYIFFISFVKFDWRNERGGIDEFDVGRRRYDYWNCIAKCERNLWSEILSRRWSDGKSQFTTAGCGKNSIIGRHFLGVYGVGLCLGSCFHRLAKKVCTFSKYINLKQFINENILNEIIFSNFYLNLTSVVLNMIWVLFSSVCDWSH